MKLYSRQLKGLEDLKREKHVLKYAAKHTEDWLSFKDMGKDSNSLSSTAGFGFVSGLLSALSSKSVLSTAFTVLPTLTAFFAKKNSSPKKDRKNPIESLAKDILIGYIKWKAVHFLYKSVMHIVKGDRNKTK